MMEISPIKDLIADIRAGKMVVVVDDENRENEGDIICAAESITGDMVAFIMRECRGLLCLAFDARGIERLQLKPARRRGESKYGTSFHDSIEAREGVTTGISAFDRACTIKTACDPTLDHEAIVTPGHVFTLKAAEGGVLTRRGHTEASYDLTRLAGRGSVGVLCEIVGDDGKMLRLEGLKAFCARQGLKLGTIEDLVQYRKENSI